MKNKAAAGSQFWILFPLCAGIFIAAGDQTVVVTILPDIMASLRVGAAQLDTASWTVTGYLIGFTAGMPFMGRVSDRYGHRAAFLGGLGVFSIGSALVAVSPNIPNLLYGGDPQFGWLVGARVLQAIGGGALIPIALAATSTTIEPSKRVVAYGIIGASAEAGGVVGPLWGGAITEWLSWHWAFWINIPLAILVAVEVARMRDGIRSQSTVDYRGAVLFVATLTMLTIALMRLGDFDWVGVLFSAAAVGSGTLLIMGSRSKAASIIPRAVVQVPQVRFANLTHVLVGAALIVGMVTVPLMAATVNSASPIDGGLRLLRMTIAVGIGAYLGGVASRRFGGRWPVLVGLLLASSGFWLMSEWRATIGDPALSAHLTMAGLGLGLVVAPIAAAAVNSAPEADRGAAAAWVTASRMIGMIIGLAAMASLGAVHFRALVSGLPAFSLDPDVQSEILQQTAQAGMTVFKQFFTASAIACVVALIPAYLMTRPAERTV